MKSIYQIPIFEDNYLFILRDFSKKKTAIIDPGDPQKAFDFLKSKGWPLDFIFITHHHWDHIDGVRELQLEYSAQVYGTWPHPSELSRPPISLKENLELPIFQGRVLETPGHTLEHYSFYFPTKEALFCGDTLFRMGCGRVLGGDLQQLYLSLQKIKTLPLNTKIYCAHEYTRQNLKFARHLNPQNKALKDLELELQKPQNKVTVPFLLSEDIKLNPFLKASHLEEFSQLRKLKDQF